MLLELDVSISSPLRNIWHIQWDNPEVLWGLVVLPLLGALLWHDWWLHRRLGRQWSQVIGVRQRSTLPSIRGILWQTCLLLTSVALAIVARVAPGSLATTLSMPTADASTPAPTYGMLASSSNP